MSLALRRTLARRAAGTIALVLPLAAGIPALAQGPMAQDPTALPAGEEQEGILLPPEFQATVFADDLGPARHLLVRDNGDVYVRLMEPVEGGGTVALRDTDGDGVADETQTFGDAADTGIALRDDWLYVSTTTEVLRYQLAPDELVPTGEPEIVVSGFPEEDQHDQKAIAFDDEGRLYVVVGAPSNACQEQDRTPGSMGQDPCPLLDQYAGIWRFPADATGLTAADGERVGSGIRNVVALDLNPASGEMFFLQHGRDQLHDNWPDLYTEEQSAELPAEEMHVLVDGTEYGWPYTYWDQLVGQRMVAPEYGGDGQTAVEAGKYPDPLLAFPGHWAPNDLLFYTGGEAFPEEWRGGAFIAFHGSWNRSPLPQGGYKVVFVPFADNRPTGESRVFADGFTGAETLEAPDAAEWRPMGLALGPDGALYISDDTKGRIWRVTWREQAVQVPQR